MSKKYMKEFDEWTEKLSQTPITKITQAEAELLIYWFNRLPERVVTEDGFFYEAREIEQWVAMIEMFIIRAIPYTKITYDDSPLGIGVYTGRYKPQ